MVSRPVRTRSRGSITTRSAWRLTLVVAAVLGVARAGVAAGPPAPSSRTMSTAVLSSEQREEIRAWVAYTAAQLGSSDAAEVVATQRQLERGLGSHQTTSPTARNEYARAAVAALEPVIEGDQLFGAVAAMQVLAKLGTNDSLDALLARIEDPRVAVRTWAAIGIVVSVRTDLDNDLIDPGPISRAARRVMRAMERETEWVVLHRQFQAVAAPGTPEAREQELEALEMVLERMAESPAPSPLIRAIHAELLSLRDRFIRLPASEQNEFGRELVPVLAALQSVAQDHWGPAQQDDAMRRAYGNVVNVSETLMRVVDPIVRGGGTDGLPDSALHQAWKDRDRQRFESAVRAWTPVVNAPPYRSPR